MHVAMAITSRMTHFLGQQIAAVHISLRTAVCSDGHPSTERQAQVPEELPHTNIHVGTHAVKSQGKGHDAMLMPHQKQVLPCLPLPQQLQCWLECPAPDYELHLQLAERQQ